MILADRDLVFSSPEDVQVVGLQNLQITKSLSFGLMRIS